MANIYRDVTLQNVSENDIGKQMKVSGWVENIRDHGGVSFIDLRDMYGVLQVVIREPELLKGIKKEECISIDGIMEQRDEETYNPKIPSGIVGFCESAQGDIGGYQCGKDFACYGSDPFYHQPKYRLL